ncbi:MAG TPA: AI-2E family transporter [Woeseiaceae bacterium]|nr:AI-2E family transporter [Woeseiaceae bacterium]
MDARDFALKGLFALAIVYALHAWSAILQPVALAIFLTLILSPLVVALKRLRVPGPVGAALVVAGLTVGFAYGVYLLFDPASEWIRQAPHTLNRVERKLRGVKHSVQNVSKAAQSVEEIASVEAKKPRRAPPAPPRPSLVNRIFTGAQSMLVSALVTVVLLYFLLASGDMFLRKCVRVAPGLDQKKRVVRVARAMRSDMGRYLTTITCINLGLGAITGAAMYLLGMPNALLWGVMVALLNFLPYIGATISLTVLALVAFLSFDSPGRILAVLGVFLTLTTLEGQVLTPTLTGKRLALNPVVVFLSMLIWAWLWGPVGALLAVPILMSCKIVCDHFERLAPIGEFLGAELATLGQRFK